MIVIDSAFLRTIGIQDGDLEAKNKYAFYKGMTMMDGTIIHNERSFYAHATVNGQVPGNQYAFFKAIGDFYNEPIYDQYSFYMNATFDGVNPIVNQYNFFKTAASLINASAASFTVSTDLPITNVTSVQFTDTSTGDVDSWLWDFGDGTTSTLQNPTHIYTSDSIWTASLTVTSADGTETTTKTLESGSIPVVDFSSDLQYTEVDTDILFTSAVTGQVDGYLWDFGDGQVSTDQNPTHKYDTEDTFTVELTATNKWGTATETKTNYIETYVPVAPVADFTVDDDNPIQDEEISFINQSTGFPEPTYLWDFGDGQTSTAKNPSHIYDTAGTYTVSLTATNDTGASTETKTGFITVKILAPIADFTVDNISPDRNDSIQFTDQSTGVVDSYLWDFGDGNTSTDQNPTHTYTTIGDYSVSLKVTNTTGDDTETKTNYIEVLMRPFILKVNSGSNSQFTIPVNNTDYTFNYNIKTSDGQTFTGLTGNKTITFPDANTDYIIEIRGTFPNIVFANGGDRLKLKEIMQWGNQKWEFMGAAFYGCANMVISATDAPDLSNVTNMNAMFRDCKSITTGNFTNWDTSNITGMSGTFRDATNFNEDISGWDVENVASWNLFSDGSALTPANTPNFL